MSDKFYQSKTFLKLQKEWYNKLKQSGHNDVEQSGKDYYRIDTCSPFMQQMSNGLTSKYTASTSQAFQLLEKFLRHCPVSPKYPLFMNKNERKCLELYINGKTLQEISNYMRSRTRPVKLTKPGPKGQSFSLFWVHATLKKLGKFAKEFHHTHKKGEFYIYNDISQALQAYHEDTGVDYSASQASQDYLKNITDTTIQELITNKPS